MEKKRGIGLLHLLNKPGMAICLFLAQVFSNRSAFLTEDPFLFALGIAVACVGISLWAYASYYLIQAQKDKKIAKTGPFRYSRHPLYSGIYILIFGLGLAFFSWFWFAVMLVFTPLWYWECRIEENEMLEFFGEEYLEYRKKTGMFLPRFTF